MRGWKNRYRGGAEEIGDNVRGDRSLRERGHGSRLFGHGDIRIVVLSLLAEKPSYGYELIKSIEERLNGAYAPSPGLVYPTLTMLERMGYASTSASEEGKNVYWATPQGEAFLKANQAEIDQIFQRMALAAERHRRSAIPQLVRAIENLKLAVRIKSDMGELTDSQIGAIAGILDEAVRRIEQC